MLSDKKDRILWLAQKYGPFVRFYPEGTESHEETPVEDTTLDSAIKTGEEATKTPEEQAAIDKARQNEQRLEQEQANTRRANEATRQAQTDLGTAQTDNEALKEQLAEAQAKAAQAGIKDVELDEKDYEGTDLALVKAIKNLEEKSKAKDTEIVGLKKKAAGYEKQARDDAALAARDSAYEGLLSDLDDEYGANCRNEALKKFGELSAAGKIPKDNAAKATRIMEKCYKDVKAAKDKPKTEKEKSSLSLDSGSGGGSAPNLSGTEIKEGSLDEVDAQVAKTELGARKS